MNSPLVDKIAQAVLYEGYILYPYRPSVKNRQRWTFGGLFPKAWSDAQTTGDASAFQTEILIEANPTTRFECKVRFLHLSDRTVDELLAPLDTWPTQFPPLGRPVESLSVDGKRYRPWQEAVEREVHVPTVSIGELANAPLIQRFDFPATQLIEPIANAAGKYVGLLRREQSSVEGEAEISAASISEGVYRLTVRVHNTTPIPSPQTLTREVAQLRSFASTHAILGIQGGQFVSMTDPPAALAPLAEQCKQIGVWPVLVGEAGERDTILVSPIILSDYPEIAPQSPGDLFDGGEIDEILTLRVMTLTDEEKMEVASIDPRAEEMLKRTESLAREQLMSLHGTMRNVGTLPQGDIFPAWDLMENRPKLPAFNKGGVELHPGDRVRLRPRGSADAMDIILAGKIAIIASIEQDYEDRIHLAVTIEDDPGADLGRDGKPGHRFFFRPNEVEPVGKEP